MGIDPAESPLALTAAFIALWVMLCYALSLLGGWNRLAEDYRLTAPFVGTKWYFRSASFRRFIGYSNVLTIGASEEGLYLAVLLPFRIGHPPLLIPWQHVKKLKPSVFSIFSLPLALGEHGPVRVNLGKRLISNLEKEHGRELPTVA